MLFVLCDVKVKACLLQSSLNSLLNLLFLSLLDGNLQLIVFYILRYACLVESNRVHGSNLHCNGVCLLLSGFVGLNHGAESVVVHVVVNRNILTLDVCIAIELHFLTCNTGAVHNLCLNGRTVDFKSLNLFERLSLCCYGSVEDSLCKGDEVLSVGNEVSFTLQGDDCREAVCALHEHATVRSLTVRTLCSDGLTLLADNLYCLLEVAVGLCKSLFAVSQAGTGHLTYLLYICY